MVYPDIDPSSCNSVEKMSANDHEDGRQESENDGKISLRISHDSRQKILFGCKTDVEEHCESYNQFDVLLGRGRSFQLYPGNRRFHGLINANAERYATSTVQAGKWKISMEIVEDVLAKGRFLKPNKEHGWTVVTLETARQKVAHALQYHQRKKRADQLKEMQMLYRLVNDDHYHDAAVDDTVGKDEDGGGSSLTTRGSPTPSACEADGNLSSMAMTTTTDPETTDQSPNNNHGNTNGETNYATTGRLTHAGCNQLLDLHLLQYGHEYTNLKEIDEKQDGNTTHRFMSSPVLGTRTVDDRASAALDAATTVPNKCPPPPFTDLADDSPSMVQRPLAGVALVSPRGNELAPPMLSFESTAELRFPSSRSMESPCYELSRLSKSTGDVHKWMAALSSKQQEMFHHTETEDNPHSSRGHEHVRLAAGRDHNAARAAQSSLAVPSLARSAFYALAPTASSTGKDLRRAAAAAVARHGCCGSRCTSPWMGPTANATAAVAAAATTVPTATHPLVRDHNLGCGSGGGVDASGDDDQEWGFYDSQFGYESKKPSAQSLEHFKHGNGPDEGSGGDNAHLVHRSSPPPLPPATLVKAQSSPKVFFPIDVADGPDGTPEDDPHPPTSAKHKGTNNTTSTVSLDLYDILRNEYRLEQQRVYEEAVAAAAAALAEAKSRHSMAMVVSPAQERAVLDPAQGRDDLYLW